MNMTSKKMTTKALSEYAQKKLPYGVVLDINKERHIKPFAENGEKYSLRNSSYKAYAHASTIAEAYEMIDDFCERNDV